MSTSNNPFTKSGLTSNTWYDFYVRSQCSNGNSDWTGPYVFHTEANYCAGEHFYDEGGPNGNYPSYNSQNKTIYPIGTGNRIKAIFNSFIINSNTTFKVYNATNSYYEESLIYSSNGGSISPGTLLATNPSGALTFVFYSNSLSTAEGWDASIICEPLPPCSNSPSDIYLNSNTTSSANFYWTENSNATSWEVEFVPQGTPPTGSGTIITSRPYTKTGLTSNTWYDLYIRSKCGNVNSTWTGPFPFNTQADYCGGDHFYDDGGPNGNYPAYDSQYVTIYPIGTGNRVKAIFNSFQLNNNDSFSVYNGTSSSAPLLFSRNSGNLIAPTTISATNLQGALTFYFNSYSQNNQGWDATIVCEPMPICSIPPSNLTIVNTSASSVTLNWTENASATSWEVIVVPQGSTPTGAGVITTTHPYTFEGLDSNTNYDAYIRSICGNVNSDWSSLLTFKTQGNYCAGDHFYDTGGANGNYQNYENYITTIFPTITGNYVQAVFNSFQMESCCDVLRIFNGPNISAALLYSGGSVSPGTKISTHPTGALTFTFSSDGSQTGSGWDATISCGNLAINANEFENSLQYYPNPTHDLLHINSKNSIEKYQVYDLNMRLILYEKVNATQFDIELSNCSSGSYFVKFFDTDNKTKEIKVLKL